MVLLSLPKTLLILHASTHFSSLQNYNVVTLMLYVIMYYILYNRHQILYLNCADEVTVIIRDSSWLRSGQKCVCQDPTACWIIYTHMQTHMHSHTDSTLQISTITHIHMQTCMHTHTLTLYSKYQQSHIHTCRHIGTHIHQQFHPPSQILTSHYRTLCALHVTHEKLACNHT